MENLEESWIQVERDLQEIITLKVFNRNALLSGVRNNFQACLELESGILQTQKKRPAFNLCLVIDQSGSMEGDKLNYAKNAAIMIVENLIEGDVLHIVTYSDTATTIFSGGNHKTKQELIAAINSIRATNSTNLYGGLEQGFSILSKEPNTARKRIFLFSDGLVNNGKTNETEIFQGVRQMHKSDINFTTFGIGSDFDEKIMRGIAEHGSGDYFFIKQAEDIVTQVGKGLKVLQDLVGCNAQLTLQGQNGAIVTKVYGYDDFDKGSVKLGDICQDDLRQLLIDIQADVTSTDSEITYLNWTLSFESAEKVSKHVVLNGSAKIKTVSDPSKIEEDPPQVKVSQAVKFSAEQDRAIKELIQSGEFDSATEKKKQAIAALEKVVSYDSTGVVKALLKLAESALVTLAEQKDVAQMEKEADYAEYGASIVHRKCF